VQRERQWNASGKYERRQIQGGYNEETGEKEFFTEIQLDAAAAAERPVKSVCISALSDFFAIVAIRTRSMLPKNALLIFAESAACYQRRIERMGATQIAPESRYVSISDSS